MYKQQYVSYLFVKNVNNRAYGEPKKTKETAPYARWLTFFTSKHETYCCLYIYSALRISKHWCNAWTECLFELSYPNVSKNVIEGSKHAILFFGPKNTLA